jgi:polyhydroxyalkanoate synthase
MPCKHDRENAHNMTQKIKRLGPYPLSIHISLVNVLAALDPDLAARVPKMLEGVKCYQAFDQNVAPKTPLDVFFEDGEFRILKYPAAKGVSNHPVVLVPSLINRYNIFDLTDEHSFVRFVADQGYDVYVLDWGKPTHDEQAGSLGGVITNRLNAAMLRIYDHCNVPVHGIGYCMGGTLLAASAALVPECFASTTTMAAPWDFHANDSVRLMEVLDHWKPTVLPIMESGQDLPLESIQALFAAVDVRGTVNKFERFADMALSSDQALLFVAVEDWLNDGVALPSGIARSCIHDWYERNTPACGEWRVDGAVIDPAQIKCPAYVVASDQDKLVPFESAKALAERVPNAQMLRLSCGHISLMAGRSCKDDVWRKIMEFIRKAS